MHAKRVPDTAEQLRVKYETGDYLVPQVRVTFKGYKDGLQEAVIKETMNYFDT